MLAYVFWHRPADGTARDAYEDTLRRFHATLDLPSATFRLARLPFDPDRDGYEDWYLVADWAALGALNDAAVAAARRSEHDAAARMSAAGWGGVYRLLRGAPVPPAGARWLAKPAGEPDDAFVAGLGAGAVWQRQMVLGPAPEFCVAAAEEPGRRQVAP